MHGRFCLAGWCVAVAGSVAPAQYSPPAPPPGSNPFPPAQGPGPARPLPPQIEIPRFPDPPRMLPPGARPPTAQPPATPQPGAAGQTPQALPDGSATPAVPADTPLPYPEARFPLDVGGVAARRTGGGWQVWAGARLLRELGDDEVGAKDMVRVLRELHPTEWVGIGGPRPVVEYGLVNGRPPVTAGFPKVVVPVDLRTARVEPVKGVWCLRDDANILFNFGLNKADADQAIAVVRRYGFNRVGMVGNPAAPSLTYFYVALQAEGPAPAANPLAVAAQENALARTGIPVPGVGFVGEMVRIDPRKAEARRDGTEWVVACGAEVLGRFGPAESTAREAVRVVRDGRFTEFCRVGHNGPTFFLVDGKAPTRVPLSTQSRQFDPAALKTYSIGGRWAVTENGRFLFDVGGPQEGEAVIRLIKYFRFDQLCQVGTSPRASLSFLGRSH